MSSRREYNRRWRKSNKESLAIRRSRSYVSFKRKLDAIKRRCGCADCGRKNGPLQFHHLDPRCKSNEVAKMANCSWSAVKEEIEKCVVLCPRCHRNRHPSGESQYPGVSLYRGRWRAKISYLGCSIHLGYFDTEEDAAFAHEAAALWFCDVI